MKIYSVGFIIMKISHYNTVYNTCIVYIYENESMEGNSYYS